MCTEVCHAKAPLCFHFFLHVEEYYDIEHEGTEEEPGDKESNKQNTESVSRARRHVGAPDHGGYQRLMATGEHVTGEERGTGMA